MLGFECLFAYDVERYFEIHSGVQHSCWQREQLHRASNALFLYAAPLARAGTTDCRARLVDAVIPIEEDAIVRCNVLEVFRDAIGFRNWRCVAGQGDVEAMFMVFYLGHLRAEK
ncbi:hypothetical protein N7471_009871 [Penicillium samsonianum]|uniref:uncharacterized protein n=1 Tax=Penicillium samsonianum TaxID=1882272 RepID=UPI0025481AF0|nr:uncharacterized protein N7471_009871 [Penicillium samsonianum]KAJ6128654.1 hypothetical protein N7471_009871 [Penicillium samsonianum]